MEYRHAYERFREGRLRLLVFVRRDIWDVLEDRQALRKFLDDEAALDKELSPEAKAKVASHPSKLVNDAEFIIDFIQEVGRIGEMKQAVKGAGDFPCGNWIYQFASFRDVVDACRAVLDLSGSLRQKALRTNLKHEIKSILAELLEPTDKGVQPITRWSKFARNSFQGKLCDKSSYRGDHLLWLRMFLLARGNVGKRLKVTAILEATMSGEFLDFDKASGTHTVGPLQEALFELEGQIDVLRNIDLTELLRDVEMTLRSDPMIENHRKAMFSFNNDLFVVPFALHDRIENIIILCRAIYLTLEGDETHLSALQLHPSSPILDESNQIAKERVTLKDVDDWLTRSAGMA
jgi:hypothetical protein